MKRIWSWLSDILFVSAPADEASPRPIIKLDTPEAWTVDELRWA